MPNEAEAQALAARKKRADYMRARGRRLGAVPVKGTTFACERCGQKTPRKHVNQRWCASCRHPALMEYKAAKRLEAGHVPIGAPLACKNCGVQFVKIHKRQFYCQPCSLLSAAEALPADKARVNEYQKKRNKRRRREIPAVAIAGRMSAGIALSLKDGKSGRSWETLVGYTVADLMRHLERQFPKGMTWDNRDRWHIDHIVPLKEFKYSTPDDNEFKAAWALTNLRPLWKSDNLSKSGKRIFLL